jgi:hypothetical protein
MCPYCKSVFLLVRERKGFERLRIALTGKRTYECLDCRKVFRINDRSRFGREAKPDWHSSKTHDPSPDPPVGDLRHDRRFKCTVNPIAVHSAHGSAPFDAVILAVLLRMQAPHPLSPGDQVTIHFADEEKNTVIRPKSVFATSARTAHTKLNCRSPNPPKTYPALAKPEAYPDHGCMMDVRQGQ